MLCHVLKQDCSLFRKCFHCNTRVRMNKLRIIFVAVVGFLFTVRETLNIVDFIYIFPTGKIYCFTHLCFEKFMIST